MKIRIEKQHWLTNESEDICSHGEIRLEVGDTIITKAGANEEWGISESALALLRTLDADYKCNPEHKEGLILHGCGSILMTGCPISIHWSVQYDGEEVELSDFVKFTSSSNTEGKIVYPHLSLTLPKSIYKQEILQFALQAKAFFDQSKSKKFEDEFDQEMYAHFWNEYNLLLTRHARD